MLNMRTTVRLEDSFLKKVKEYAARKGMTLTSVFEKALKELLYRQESYSKSSLVKLPTAKSMGTCPGVDLDNNSALLDLMEDR